MKKLYILSSAILVCVLAFFATTFFIKTAKYSPSKDQFSTAQYWSGAAKYYYDIRKNPTTGEISAYDVLGARKAMKAFNQSAQKSGTTFDWQEMGPDNYGGRTRAILVDNTVADGSRIYAGGVSGGLFVSNDFGGTWSPVLNQTEAMTIASIEQGPDGTIWIGTGTVFDIVTLQGEGSSSFPGSGLYKLTPGSTNIELVPSAAPVQPFANALTGTASSPDWTYIDAIAFYGNDIYAGTNNGLQRSSDNGVTWTNPVQIGITTITTDVQDIQILSNGTILAAIGGRLYRADGSDQNTFVQIGGTEGLVGSSRRMRLAVAPTNENHVYAITVQGVGFFEGFYESLDGGQTFSKKPTLSTFLPFGDNQQGYYDLMLQVDPNDENIVYIGGIDIWKYNSGSFTHLTAWNAQNFLPYYVHADQHSSEISHADKSLYFGTDGGVFRTYDGGNQFISSNRGYNVTQFYSVTYSEQGWAMGGTQDNGTIAISGEGFYEQQGNFAGGGDGFDAEFSQLTDYLFTTVYGAAVNRGKDNTAGGAFCGPWNCGVGSDFYTVVKLWESFNDQTSKDSIVFKAEDGTTDFVIGISDGVKRNYFGTIEKVQTAGNFVPGSIVFKAGTQTIQDTGTAGILTDLNGDSVGTFNYLTGAYNIDFASAPSNQLLIKANYSLAYQPGSTVFLSSLTPNVKLRGNDFTVDYFLAGGLQPGDSVLVQDPVQSLFVYGGINVLYITRAALKDQNSLENWFTVNNAISGQTKAIEFSKDGNHMFVGTFNGRLYRISGLNDVYNQDDARLVADGGVLTSTLIANEGSGKVITGVAVDVNNPENVVYTIGGYGSHDHIMRSTSAVSATDDQSFSSIQGNLPAMPVYDAIISFDLNKHIVVGTEFGVYSALFTNPTSWTSLNNNLPNVPVFAVRQQTMPWEVTDHQGTIYLGTHGRGIWKSTTLLSDALIEYNSFGASELSDLVVYPNPSVRGSQVSVSFESLASNNANLQVFDLSGQMVYNATKQVVKGNNVLLLPNNLTQGNYVVSLQVEGLQKTAKFFVY